MSESSFKVADKLFLVRQTVNQTAPAAPVEVPTNHILVVDCSGSMSGDLPQIRAQLKKKLPKLIAEKDTLSIVWFSGKNQFGTLIEAEPVATLTDLKTVEAAIDRWLKPCCLTGFKEPLIEVSKLVGRVAKARPGSVFSMIFMSDGHDNCWSRPDILKAVETAAGGLAAATFVEYGYYADRPLLTAMAEKVGGSLIFAEAFDKFEPMVEAALQKRPMGGKRVSVPVAGDTIGGFVWAEDGTDIVTFGVEKGTASVPEHTRAVYYLSPTAVGVSITVYDLNAAYAALSLFSVRMQPEIVLPFLRLTGDVAFIEQFSGLFGKQRYSAFMDQAKAACFDPSKRLTKGQNSNLLPKDDAFTVLDALRLLQGDDSNRVLVDSPLFKYSRIGRARVNADSVLTAEEQAEVEKLTEELRNNVKVVAKAKEIMVKISAITDKPTPLKFEGTPSVDGYSISNLTWNEENPNVSILVRREGTVDLTSRLPKELADILPFKFPTFTFRNYAIIKDGLVNVDQLPVKLSDATKATLDGLVKKGDLPASVITTEGDVTLFNFKALPIINRKMVKATSAKALFETEWSLLKTQSSQKVYNSIVKELGAGKKSATFIDTYGQAAADWLKEAGFTDYSGFSPKSVQAEARDFYMAKELKVAVKGYSSIPSLNEFRKQAAKGKFGSAAALMTDAFKAVETFQATADGKDPVKFEAWLKAQAKALDVQRRKLISDKAQTIFCVIVGQVWFTEFASLDENTMKLTVDGQSLDCTVTATEVQVKI